MVSRPDAISHDDAAVDLREYLAVVHARRWNIIIVTLLVVAAAVAFSLIQTPLYTASARVLVDPLPTDPQSFDPVQAVDLNTQREIATSEPVAALVKDELDRQEPTDELLEKLSVEGLTETRILVVSYTSPDPVEAQALANAFADKYLQYRRQQGLEFFVSQESALQLRLEAATTQLAEVTADLQAAERANDDALLPSFESQRNVLITRLGLLQQQLDEIQQQRSAQTGGGSVIEAALRPEAPSSPNLVRSIALALFLGLVLGIGMAFLRERLDDRVRSRHELEHLTHAPVLATVPRFKQKDNTPYAVVGREPNGAAAEAFRSLRTNLQFVAAQSGIASIVITSAGEGEGKTSVSVNLATALASAGKRVILVSGDLRKPTLERYFNNLRAEYGLSEWLSNQADDLATIIRDPGIPNLRIVPCGAVPPNPAELLSSMRLPEMVPALEQHSDFLIFDSPPALAVADPGIIAAHVGGTILVANAATASRNEVTHAAMGIERAGGHVVGSVWNSFEPAEFPSYYGAYTSYGTYAPNVDTAVDVSNGGDSGSRRAVGSVRQR